MRSPQMLMVSGIGPRETLDDLVIEVISDRPGVCQNEWVFYLAPDISCRAKVNSAFCALGVQINPV